MQTETPYYIATPQITTDDIKTVYGNSWLDTPWISDPNETTVQGLESTGQAVQAPPAISSIQSVWNSIKSNSESALQTVEGGVKATVKTIWEGPDILRTSNLKAGLDAVTTTATNTYLYLLLGVVVLGAAIYFAGKSGAIRVHAVV